MRGEDDLIILEDEPLGETDETKIIIEKYSDVTDLKI